MRAKVIGTAVAASVALALVVGASAGVFRHLSGNPVAQITASATSVAPSQLITFGCGSSTDTDATATLTSCTWAWGDGTPDTTAGLGVSPQHAYAHVGSY